MMLVGNGEHTYEWIDNWAKVPDTPSAREGWAHHGIVVSEAGDIITYHPGESKVLVFDKDGNLQDSWDSRVLEGHGMTLVKEGGNEYLWIVDCGDKAFKSEAYVQAFEKPPGTHIPNGQVVKKTLDGRTVMTLDIPPHPVYEEGRYSPTTVTVNEERHGGNGDIWVSDGYGMYYIHRFDKNGKYISSFNGEEGAGKLTIPHGVWIDRRKAEPELYVADQWPVSEGPPRTWDGRVQVYDLEGKFKRAFGQGDIIQPRRGISVTGDFMVLPELCARIAIFDVDDKFVSYLADNQSATQTSGWPNSHDEKGGRVRRNDLTPGIINSPHDMAMDADGNLYLAEFLIGGRISKLVRRA